MTLITVISKSLYDLVPIIFEFKEQITKHIIIYDLDHKDKKIAKKLKKGILKVNKKHKLTQEIELLEIDEDSRSDMLHIQNSLRNLDLDRLYLNATDADISLVVVLSGFLLNTGGKIIAYDKLDNTYNLIDKIGFSNHKIKNSMSIEDNLDFMCYKLVEEVDKKTVFSNSEALNLIFNDIKLMFKVRRFIARNRVDIIEKEYPSFIEPLQKLGILEELEVSKNKNMSFFGYLFEEYIYLMLLKYDFDDMKIGAKIIFDTKVDKVNYISIENEFDIIAIKNNHIYTVECKLGDNIVPQNIIYKSDSLLGYFGDDSKNLIINLQINKQSQYRLSDKVFKDMAIFRATTNNIEIFNEYDLGSRKFDKKISKFFELKKRVFLLGGNDLEMQTIKKLLDKTEQIYYDKKLSWGAKLSEYEEKLNPEYIYVGVELEEDIRLPENYICIDHHNKNQKKGSSLEQIALLLNIELNRYEQLVAVNDKGHIPALLKFGASKKEITSIRRKDRKAQGVTQNDEDLALKSMQYEEIIDDTIVIKSLSDKFSPIVDVLYAKNLLLYTDTKITYYGKDVEMLTKHYKTLVDEKKAYFGGNYGFFGIAEGSFSKKELKKLKKEIVSLL